MTVLDSFRNPPVAVAESLDVPTSLITNPCGISDVYGNNGFLNCLNVANQLLVGGSPVGGASKLKYGGWASLPPASLPNLTDVSVPITTLFNVTNDPIYTIVNPGSIQVSESGLYLCFSSAFTMNFGANAGILQISVTGYDQFSNAVPIALNTAYNCCTVIMPRNAGQFINWSMLQNSGTASAFTGSEYLFIVKLTDL